MVRFNQSRLAHVRTLFLSDVHLGFKRARAAELGDFLQTIEADTIILVGDIIDALSLRQRFFWSEHHSRVVQLLLAKRRAGARLLYLPGNHDASLAAFAPLLQGQVEVHREWVHRTARGERLLVLHGDQFDEVLHTGGWLHRLGEAMYDMTVVFSDHLNDLRRLLHRSYWPIAARLKVAVGESLRYIESFEDMALAHAAERGYDGIVCGHIHRANLRRVGEAVYCNTGDWVESCSALIEEPDGALRLWQLGDPLGAGAERPVPLLADAA
jgi:UDP-2,3-diacylglucosamine pyrophosphatase LpxH